MPEMNDETWRALEAFVRAEIGIRPSRPIRPSDSLERDLDLTGDDADDFMGKFFEQFPVQPGDYQFERYFSEEGLNLLTIIAMPFSRKTRQRYEKEPLTVGMLRQAIVLGAWDSKKLTA